MGEVEIRGQLVQVHGGVCLGGHDLGQALWVERLDQAVVEDGGAVDHRAQRVLIRNLAQQLFELAAVGDVATGEPDLGTELFQVRAQSRRAAGPLAGATNQQEVSGTVGFDQVLGDQGSKAAGGAGDQDRALGVEGSDLRLLALCRDQTGNE